MITDLTAGQPVDLDIVAPVVTLLARRTAEMHTASKRGNRAFAPEPVTAAWQTDLLDQLAVSLTRTQQALKRSLADLPADTAAASGVLIEQGDQLLAGFGDLRERPLGGSRIRVHGDFHLGQVLWTGDDVVIIDFEGEPDRSIAEREMTQSPLVDVAGMLRSLDYAGRVAFAEHDAGAALADEWRSELTHGIQELFWTGYRDAAGAELIPDDDRDARTLLEVHLALKALYEVRYELANRPHWVAWPLAAV